MRAFFTISQPRLPADSVFPVNRPKLEMEAITETERFWIHLEEYPGLEQKRPDNTYSICDSAGLEILGVTAIRGPLNTGLEVIKGHFAPGPSIDDMIGRYMDAISRMEVYGIKVRLNGELKDLLQLYRHVVGEFPRLLLLDERARRAYDEPSFADHVARKG